MARSQNKTACKPSHAYRNILHTEYYTASILALIPGASPCIASSNFRIRTQTIYMYQDREFSPAFHMTGAFRSELGEVVRAACHRHKVMRTLCHVLSKQLGLPQSVTARAAPAQSSNTSITFRARANLWSQVEPSLSRPW